MYRVSQNVDDAVDHHVTPHPPAQVRTGFDNDPIKFAIPMPHSNPQPPACSLTEFRGGFCDVRMPCACIVAAIGRWYCHAPAPAHDKVNLLLLSLRSGSINSKGRLIRVLSRAKDLSGLNDPGHAPEVSPGTSSQPTLLLSQKGPPEHGGGTLLRNVSPAHRVPSKSATKPNTRSLPSCTNVPRPCGDEQYPVPLHTVFHDMPFTKGFRRGYARRTLLCFLVHPCVGQHSSRTVVCCESAIWILDRRDTDQTGHIAG